VKITREIDPITLEICWTRLVSMVDEAAANLVRTSFSTIVRECNDYAVVLTDAQGRLLAQSSYSIPSFICTLPLTVRHFIAKFGAEGFKPGDVMITNDPWLGTGHLPDVNIAIPIFYKGRLIAFAASVAHVSDIGGRLRSPSNREVYEEGLRITPMKLVRDGEVNDTLVSIITDNVRVSAEVLGDIWAQVSCDRSLATRLVDFLDSIEVDLDVLGTIMFQRADAAMRAAISRLPDGAYSNEMVIEGSEGDIVLKCRLVVEGDAIAIDYEGSSNQVAQAINVVPSYTFAYSAYALKCLLAPEIPNNDGSFLSIRTDAPYGSILNPSFPASVGARAMTGHLLPPLIMGALSKVMPGEVQAAPGSPLWAVQLAGSHRSRPFAMTFFLNGGQGASENRDGLPTLSFPSNLANTPIEVLESRCPIKVIRKELRRGTGGSGKHRGGDGQIFEFRLEADAPVTVSFMANRTDYPAPGINGGASGAVGRILADNKPLNPRVVSVLSPGTVLRLETPGGGGYGTSELLNG
jgi:N-methylhydantoinase B